MAFVIDLILYLLKYFYGERCFLDVKETFLLRCLANFLGIVKTIIKASEKVRVTLTKGGFK
jgi:hypothetical protein